ncbi:MAG TPA: TasA family protein [Bacillota bacterium]|jgi:predicted ribosomally synthesized peptide with SipW-like signal peptide|nr:TasA family protein [Bacillota bacterium]HPZ42050.1 TasA family protein [Bacillota bacterium]HQD52983.1 TasA family protein [Bacillota bacterium]
MNKKVKIGLAILTLAALLAVGTWAWFTATAEPVINQFTAGTVKIAINDVYDEELNWNPGDTTKKEVSIKNEGTKCAYVRVKLIPTWGDKVNGDFVADAGLPTTNVALNWNTTDWMLHTDGYYYYKSTLPAGEETPLLLESVTLVGSSTGNEYQGKVLRIEVQADAVQCTNDAYKSVWGMDNLPW